MSAMQSTAAASAARHHRESEYAPGNSPTIKMEDVAPVYAGGTFKLPKEKVWSPGYSWMPPRRNQHSASQGAERTSSLSFKPPSIGSPKREKSPPASTFSSAVSYITQSTPVEYVRSMFVTKNTSCEQGDNSPQDDGDGLPVKPNLALDTAESVAADTFNSPVSAVVEKIPVSQDVSSSVDPVLPAKGVQAQKQALTTKLEKLASQRQRRMTHPSSPFTMENPQMPINTVQVARSTQHSYRITSKGTEYLTEGPTLLETRQEASAVRSKFHSRFNQQVDFPLDPPKTPTMTTLRYSRKSKPPPPILPPKKEVTEYRSPSARRLDTRMLSPPKTNVEEYHYDSNVSNSASPSSPREGRSKKSPVTVKTSMRKMPTASKGVAGSASDASGKKLSPIHFTEGTSYQHKTSFPKTNTGGKNEAAWKKSPMSDLPLVVKSPTMTPLKTFTYRAPPTESRYSSYLGAAKSASAVAAGAAAGAAAAAAATATATEMEFDDKSGIDDAKAFDCGGSRSRSPSPQVDNLIPPRAYSHSPRSRQSPSPARKPVPSPVRKQAEETSSVRSAHGDVEQDQESPNEPCGEQQYESRVESVNVLEQYNGNPTDFASAATMLGELP